MLPSIFCSLRERVVLYCHGQRHKRWSELWLRLALDTPGSLWLPWGWLSIQPIQGWKEAGVKERYVFGVLPWTPLGEHVDCRIFPPFSLRRTYISEIRKHGKCSEFRCLRAYVQGEWISGVAPYGEETVLKMWGAGAGWDSQAPVGGSAEQSPEAGGLRHVQQTPQCCLGPTCAQPTPMTQIFWVQRSSKESWASQGVKTEEDKNAV